MDRPEYVVLVLLFEPKPTAASSHKVLAGLNAAPTTGRIIERIGPLLGVTSADAGALPDGTAFDVTSSTK
jgi:cell division protein FtsI (penicillin-binding protein 3)